MRRRFYWGLLAVLSVCILAGLGAILLARANRTALAEQYLQRLSKGRKGWAIRYSALKPAGSWGVRIDSLSVTYGNSIRLRTKGLVLHPDPWSLVVGTKRLENLELDSLWLDVVSDTPTPEATTKTSESADSLRQKSPWQSLQALQEQASGLLSRMPSSFRIHHATLKHQYLGHTDSITVQGLLPDKRGQRLAGELIVGADTARLYISPQPKIQRITVGWERGKCATWHLPALQAKWGLVVGGSQGELQVLFQRKGRFEVTTQGRTVNVQHPLLATNLVQFDRLELKLVGNWLQDGVVLDSTQCRYRLNTYTGYLGGILRALPTDTLLTFTLASDTLQAGSVLDSLPRGLLPHIEGMRVAGRFRQHLFVQLHTSQVDSALFLPTFWCDSCRVQRWGNVNPQILNDTFTHRTYREQRRLRIGPGSPNYTPLTDITPYVWKSLMISEDGGFYGHQGFYPEMIGKALAINLSKGRLLRGGSTITMQLVKNVFLTPAKNLSRKVEEALLVWLIESQHLVSKSRLLEVYLNVIEWGPGIYGITEAAQYYFGKHPAQLYYPEGIFLAMIVPSPRNFRFHFDSTGHIRPHVQKYYSILLEHLLNRGVITAPELANWHPETFTLTGLAARDLGQTPEPLRPDISPSTEELIEDLEFFDEDFDLSDG